MYCCWLTTWPLELYVSESVLMSSLIVQSWLDFSCEGVAGLEARGGLLGGWRAASQCLSQRDDTRGRGGHWYMRSRDVPNGERGGKRTYGRDDVKIARQRDHGVLRGRRTIMKLLTGRFVFFSLASAPESRCAPLSKLPPHRVVCVSL